MKLRVFTLCSGYDSQCLALDELKRNHPDFDYELIGWSEIDKYASQAHDALYPQWSDRNYGDMTKIDWNEVPDFDLLTFSTPCQDISTAGLQRGIAEGSDTRSAIVWKVLDCVEIKRPKYLLQENVKALVGKKFLPFYTEFNRRLEAMGYSVFGQIMNAKDYGVPQNRERVFVVSIHNFDGIYTFPSKQELKVTLNDVLEDEVAESYYLKDETVQKYLDKVKANEAEGKGFGFFPETPSATSAEQ